MPRIDLKTLARELQPDLVPAAATLSVQAWAGSKPFTEVAGENVIVSPPQEVIFQAGVPGREIHLEPTLGAFCYRVTLKRSGAVLIDWYVEVPAVAEVAFGDLQQVDPTTFEPVPNIVAAWETVRTETREARDETVAAAATAGEAVSEAQGAASDAAGSAGLASSAAGAASDAAGDALSSATAASVAAGAAGDARDDSIAARSGAEEARRAAEQTVAGLPAVIDPAVAQSISAANIPAKADLAVQANIAGRDLVQRNDPGTSRVKTYENDEYARAWGGGAGLGRVFGGWTRQGWWKLPRGFNYGNRRARMATSDQFLRATVLGNRVAEDALDFQGNVPVSILKRWGARIAGAGAAALAAWPFQPKATTVIRTVRKDGSGEFTTITAAVAASADGSPAKKYIIDVGDGIYQEAKLLRDSSYITVRGRHPRTARVEGYLPATATDTQVADFSTFDLRGTECYIENLTVTVQNGRYAVHPELNGLNPDSIYAGSGCHFEHLGNTEIDTWRAANPSQVGAGFDRVAPGGFNGGRCAIGEGTASGASLVLTNSTVKGPSTYFLHDNVGFTKPSYHRFERTRFVGSSILILNGIGGGLASMLEFVACRFDAERFVFQDSDWKSTALDQPASHFELQPHFSGSTPVGATFASMRGRALRIESAATIAPSSVRVTGTAADAVMGTVRTRDGGGGLKGYAWGYKDISGMNGGASGTTPLVNTIGRLLGDCSVTAKTLTVTVNGGAPVDVVFNSDMTAATNASILATINTALGSAATASEYAVDQGESYPHTDHEAILLNDGTTGIGRWNAVKWGGNRRSTRLVTTADAASTFVGVALEPIPPGSYGRVLLRGKLFAASGVEGQIPGVTALTAGDTISLSSGTDGQFTVGAGKPVGVASDTNMFAFNV